MFTIDEINFSLFISAILMLIAGIAGEVGPWTCAALIVFFADLRFKFK